MLVILLHMLNLGQALVPCNGNVTKLQLCTLSSEYDKGMPSDPPLNLLTSITIFSISEVEPIGWQINKANTVKPQK